MENIEISNKLEFLAFLFLRTLREKLNLAEKETLLMKIDCNYYKIMLKVEKSNEIQIKMLQILDAGSVFFAMEPSRFYNFTINFNNFFNPQIKNSYKLENSEIYFKKGGKRRLLDLFEIRILNKLKNNEKKWQFVDIMENLLARIVVFLDRKSLWALIRTNQELYKRFFQRNEFWEGVYHCRFKKTGFKTNLVVWKEAFINKMK